MYQGVILEIFNIGGSELALIMVAVLLLFGGKKLPELARGLGKGIREFKDASEDVKREINRNINAVTTEVNAATKEVHTPLDQIDHSSYHHPEEDQNVHAEAEDANRYRGQEADANIESAVEQPDANNEQVEQLAQTGTDLESQSENQKTNKEIN